MSNLSEFRNRILIHLGAEICPVCGSKDVVQRGFEDWNHRHQCQSCGKESWI